MPLFASFVGQLPSEMIAKVLQEESAVIRLDNKQLDCMRLADLVKQTPKLNLPQGVGEQVESGFLQRHLVPSFTRQTITVPLSKVIRKSTRFTICLTP